MTGLASSEVCVCAVTVVSLFFRTDDPQQQPKKTPNPFTLPSILTADPSSTLAKSLVLHGRTLDVVRAVTRDEAGKLREEGEKRREKADKRNMYLLREGVILPNTPASLTLPPADLERRTGSFNARKALLKSNPSLYVSKTRLSVRQIPIFVTERMMRRLAVHAVKAFEAEVGKGARVGLGEDELTRDADDGDDGEQGEAKGKGKRNNKGRGVKQAKIIRQQERVDPITGKGRSKGYGFVEMHTHADALRVLRWVNNNPEVGGLFEEWWREELEDLVKKAKKEKKEGEKDEKDESRLKRMKEELEKGAEGRKGKGKRGTLIVEFSIENIQVVKRRDALQKERVSTGSEITKKPWEKLALKREEDHSVPAAKKRRFSEDKDKLKVKKEPSKKRESSRIQREEKQNSASPPKKRRLSTEEVKKETSKPGLKIGSLIGRKRKQRKAVRA